MSNRIARLALVVAAASLVAAPAWAANVVDVRVGTHPTYTRVVFELDASAGYRVERELSTDGVPQLLVTIEAGSGPRSLSANTLMVERVAVQDGSELAIAHIRLKQKPSRLKEMILTSPPRLVFDFVYPENVLAARKAAEAKSAAQTAKATVAPPQRSAITSEAQTPAGMQAAAEAEVAPRARSEAAATAAARAKQAAAAKKAEAEAAARKAREEAVAAARKAEAEAARTAKLEAEAAARKAQAESAARKAETQAAARKAAAEAAARRAEQEATARRATAQAEAEAAARKAEAEAAALKARAEAAAAQPLAGAAQPGAPQAVKQEIEALAKSAPARRPAAAPRQPEPAAASSSGSDWQLPVGIAAALLAAVIVFFVWQRRRALPNDSDVTALAEAAADGGDSGHAMGSTEETPAGPLFETPAPAGPAPESRIAAGPGLFEDDEPEKESDTMDIERDDLPMERTASEMPTQVGVGAAAAGQGGDVARMLREFESRLVQLETRLDESNDARERLERQVTAQAEELRVQRAAIARTQRALRSMNRGEEEQATEPALREPSS